MPGPKGVLSLREDLKRSYDYYTKAVELAATTQVPNSMMQVSASSKKLSPSELEIPENKSGATKVKPGIEVDIKATNLETSDSSKTALIGSGLDSK